MSGTRFFALVLFFSCGFTASLLAQSPGKLSVVVGDVKVTPPGGAAVVANVDQEVLAGSVIATGANSRAVLVTTRQSAVRISENSEVAVSDLDDSDATPKVLLDLKSGSLGAFIQPQAQTVMDFRIKTPSGTAAARGTFYAVAVENGKGFVQVKEGRVALSPDNPPAQPQPQPGTVSMIQGQVQIIPPGGGAAQALNQGDKVAVGSTITTGPDSRAVVVMTKDAAINVSADTETVLEEIDETEPDKPKVAVNLKNGSLGALINPQVAGTMDFRIKTPSGTAAARGTFFSVAVENGLGYIKVKDGTVNVIPITEGNEGANQQN